MQQPITHKMKNMNSKTFKINPNETVGIQTLAEVLGLEQTTVWRHAKAGNIVKASRGRYLLWPSVHGYLQFLQNSQKNPTKQHTIDKSEAETRLKIAQASRMERQNAEAEGLLVPAENVEQILSNAFGQVYKVLEQIKPRLRRRFSFMTQKQLNLVDDEVRKIQNFTATLKLDDVKGQFEFEGELEELDPELDDEIV